MDNDPQPNLTPPTTPEPVIQPAPFPPAPENQPFQQPPEPKMPEKKSKKKLVITIIISILVFIGLIVVLFVFLKNNQFLANNIGTQNKTNISSSQSSKTHATGKVSIGGISMNVVDSGMGIYKIRDEYVFRGGEETHRGDIDKEDDPIEDWLPNFVRFNNHLWRIVKVNSDKSVKLMAFADIDERQIDKNNYDMFYNGLNITHRFNDDTVGDLSLNKDYTKSALRSYLNSDDFILNYHRELLPKSYKDYLVKQPYDISKMHVIYDDENKLPSGIRFKLSDPEYSSEEDYVSILSAREYIEASTKIDLSSKIYNCRSEKEDDRGCGEENFIANSGVGVTTTATDLEYNADNNSDSMDQLLRFWGGRISGVYPHMNEAWECTPIININKDIKFSSGTGLPTDPYVIL